MLGNIVLPTQAGLQKAIDDLVLSDGGSTLSYFGDASEFPNLGDETTLYIVTPIGKEAIYRWDGVELKYFVVSNNYNNVKIINGGNANG